MSPKKVIIGFVLLAVFVYGAIALLVFNLGGNAIDSYSDTSEKYKSYIGKEFVIKKDTLMITDYSIIQESFTLQDGTEVNANLIFNKQ